MSASRPRMTLPLRRWLLLALGVVFFVPVFVTAAIVFHFLTSEIETKPATLLRDNAPRWSDPAWQEATRSELAKQDVDFVLIEDGSEVYRSTAEPLVGSEARAVKRIVVPDGEIERVAFIYADDFFELGEDGNGPPGDAPFWLVPIAAVTALLLTLGGTAWFLGRTVVKPLAATSEAARRVAAGDLDVALPSSRVREVAELNSAFETMSAELRASLQQQAEIEQERRLFIGAVAHDLRTPLFSLRGYLEGLEKGMADTPEKRARYIAVAQEKAAALDRLITDLFAYTRMEYLDMAPNREPFDLAVLLQRLVDGLQPQAETKGVRLVFDEPAAPCIVDGDSHLLTRAVENLLDNALRFTPSGGDVRVDCRVESAQVRFSVADSGPGIPAQDLPHLFTPLFRGEASRNRRTGGAGLGLTIARRILRAHGGDLVARNRLDGGAVFTGSVPHAESRPNHAELPPLHAELVEASGSRELDDRES